MSGIHLVLKTPIHPPFPAHTKSAIFGLGCFWGAEKLFWEQPGVYTTHVGYAGGHTQNPTYEQVCRGITGHAEVVRVVYDPQIVPFLDLLKLFWTSHDPTTLNQQGNDRGDQYRSAIYYYDEEQKEQIQSTCETYQRLLTAKGFGSITTEIAAAGEFYYAEEYHQQYPARGLRQYCGLSPTGVVFEDQSGAKL